MADTIPGTSAVKDQRAQPRGVLPRHAQTWLMVVIALGILAVIFFTGQPAPTVRPPDTQPAAVPDADRLRSYQERLRSLNERARRQPTEAPPTSPMPAPQPAADPAVDPLDAERKRLEYHSLFTPAMIRVSGQPTDTRHRAADIGAEYLDTRSPAAAPATLDAIAAAVIRATQSGNQTQSEQTPLPNTSERGPRGSGEQGRSESTGNPSTASNDGRPRYRLPEGTVIPTVLRNELDGTFAGPVICMVTSPVYDLPAQRVLIPAGATVLGTASPVRASGDTRLAVTFDKLRLPDKSEYVLDQFVGANQRGDTGLRDRVNRHYGSTFGAAAAVGLLSGFSNAIGTAALGSRGQPTIVIGGVTTETANATSRTVEQLLNRLPTVTIGYGHRVHIYLMTDLHLPAFPMPATSEPSGTTQEKQP